jgi:hypothetical protein
VNALFNIASIFRFCFLLGAFLALSGCQTQRNIAFDAANPAVTVTPYGIYFAEEKVSARELPEILEDLGVPKTRTIHIQLDENVRDLSEARFVMGMLAKAGYTRPVLVTKRHAESMAVGKKKPSSFSGPQNGRNPQVKQIRYKRAGE